MWVEAILLKEDLEKLIAKLLPVDVKLGDEGHLALHDPSEVSLVPDVGLRAVCKAKLTWPVLGFDVPVSLHSLTVVLRPQVEARDGAPHLVFALEVEHADVAGVPTMIDDKITERVNVELAAKNVELAWAISETLTHAFPLPDSLEPLETLTLGVADARVKITAEALGLAILFRFDVARDRETHFAASSPPSPPPSRPAPSPPPKPIPPPASTPTAAGMLMVPTNFAIVAGLAAVAMGSLVGLIGNRRRRLW